MLEQLQRRTFNMKNRYGIYVELSYMFFFYIKITRQLTRRKLNIIAEWEFLEKHFIIHRNLLYALKLRELIVRPTAKLKRRRRRIAYVYMYALFYYT